VWIAIGERTSACHEVACVASDVRDVCRCDGVDPKSPYGESDPRSAARLCGEKTRLRRRSAARFRLDRGQIRKPTETYERYTEPGPLAPRRVTWHPRMASIVGNGIARDVAWWHAHRSLRDLRSTRDRRFRCSVSCAPRSHAAVRCAEGLAHGSPHERAGVGRTSQRGPGDRQPRSSRTSCGCSTVRWRTTARRFFVMELIEGSDLARLLQREERPIDNATGGVVDSFKCSPRCPLRTLGGSFHRDVKPANIFVSSVREPSGAMHEHVRLVDFGISKIRDDASVRTQPGMSMGTPGYMAPEQLADAADADPRADVYAVCVVLFEMLAGRLPFDASNVQAFVSRMLTERAPSLAQVAPHVPVQLAAVVDCGLARAPCRALWHRRHRSLPRFSPSRTWIRAQRAVRVIRSDTPRPSPVPTPSPFIVPSAADATDGIDTDRAAGDIADTTSAVESPKWRRARRRDWCRGCFLIMGVALAAFVLGRADGRIDSSASPATPSVSTNPPHSVHGRTSDAAGAAALERRDASCARHDRARRRRSHSLATSEWLVRSGADPGGRDTCGAIDVGVPRSRRCCAWTNPVQCSRRPDHRRGVCRQSRHGLPTAQAAPASRSG